MTSEERREARYRRRKERRKAKRDKLASSIGTAEEVFCYHDMFRYGKQCTRGVMWKQSAQNFRRHLFSRTAANRKRVLSKKGYKPKRLVRFTLNERGKTRHIEAPHIDDRQIQKCLTKKVLLPLYAPRMIYDNGASIEGKGLLFAQNQLDGAIRRHVKRYGLSGHIILADFSGFFPNADRNVVKRRHLEIKDRRLRAILDAVTDAGSGDKGLPLGVEPSQAEMVALPSPLDAYMSCQTRCSGFGHYMDDYHMLIPPGSDPAAVLETFITKAARLGIRVSRDKTSIVPVGKPFRFCKRQRLVSVNHYGDVVIRSRGYPSSRKRARRKIRYFAKACGKMSFEDIYTSANSSIAYFAQTDSHGTVLSLRRLFYALFGFSCEDVQEFRRGNLENGICMPQEI